MFKTTHLNYYYYYLIELKISIYLQHLSKQTQDFSLNTLQFDLIPQDISKISIVLCMARIVTIIDLHYLLKLLYKLKGQKIHSIKMKDF